MFKLSSSIQCNYCLSLYRFVTRYDMMSGTAVFEITMLLSDDLGEYTCIAQNKIGQDTTAASLLPTGKLTKELCFLSSLLSYSVSEFIFPVSQAFWPSADYRTDTSIVITHSPCDYTLSQSLFVISYFAVSYCWGCVVSTHVCMLIYRHKTDGNELWGKVYFQFDHRTKLNHYSTLPLSFVLFYMKWVLNVP